MIHNRYLQFIALFGLVLIASSCTRSRDQFWDDSKSCQRHVARGVRSLGGKGGDSRQVACRDDFLCANESGYDFVPLEDDEYGELAMNDIHLRQPKYSPGDPGSPIPGIDEFEDPQMNPELARVFRIVYFPYDSNLLKGEENLSTIRKIAGYMNANPKVSIFVEGHCDERGPQAYNLALGTRRANSVRSLLIEQGVSPERIYTISYGKERPFAMGHSEEAWRQNRRGEFKIYHHRSGVRR